MLHFTHPLAEICFPNPSQSDTLSKTTHLGIGAHQDDLEMMAIHGILSAYDNPEAFFTGVTVTDGRGAPRNGPYANMSDDDLWEIRRAEQNEAARVGKYLAQISLDFSSHKVKSTNRQQVVDELKMILQETQPHVIYTHNLADKHDTHVAVALAVIKACRETTDLPENFHVYGCEIWRGLDWLPDDLKVAFDISAHPDLQERLLSVFRSQIAGGKRYDLAAIGRWQANATYYQSHETDQAERMIFAMDLTPLVKNKEASISNFVGETIRALSEDVQDRLVRLG